MYNKTPRYTFSLAKPESGQPPIVIVHDGEYQSAFDETMLNVTIRHLKDNRRAYADEAVYNNILAMLTGALRFLQEEQS